MLKAQMIGKDDVAKGHVYQNVDPRVHIEASGLRGPISDLWRPWVSTTMYTKN